MVVRKEETGALLRRQRSDLPQGTQHHNQQGVDSNDPNALSPAGFLTCSGVRMSEGFEVEKHSGRRQLLEFGHLDNNFHLGQGQNSVRGPRLGTKAWPASSSVSRLSINQ